jgi:hypothetical protein
MSEEEKAIAPDPSGGGGAEQAVILVEETELNDGDEGFVKLAYHLRAKILSNEARDLANVVIDYNRNAGFLKNWWGRTLLPDGSVVELKQEQLEEQTVEQASGHKSAKLKAALPGVVPGCVIDYGYSIWKREWSRTTQVPLQRPWPMRRFRYRWVPWGAEPAHYHVSRAEGMAVKVTQEAGAVFVSGENLPPAAEELLAPPEDQTRATATFYYSTLAKGQDDFWNAWAVRKEREVRAFASDDRPIKEALLAMKIAPEAELRDRLRAVYEWMASNLKNTSLSAPGEGEESNGDGSKKARDSAGTVLTAKAGTARQFDYLFLALARILGAEADLVMVVDRTQRYWDSRLLTDSQFDGSLVCVRSPGDPDEKAVFVDPGSGLPYGQVPWWHDGMKGLLVGAKTARDVTIWPSEPVQNVSDSNVKVDFSIDGGSLLLRWSRVVTGQQGIQALRTLRGQPAERRDDMLDDLCGSSDRYEISRAQASGWEDPGADLRLECEGRANQPGPDVSYDQWGQGFLGPWIDWVPEFVSPTRANPVIFPFRRVERAGIDVSPPPGFVTLPAPPPVQLEGPFGRYFLAISNKDGGYHLERAFVIVRLVTAPAEYPALKNFLDEVRRADGTHLQFKRARGAS